MQNLNKKNQIPDLSRKDRLRLFKQSNTVPYSDLNYTKINYKNKISTTHSNSIAFLKLVDYDSSILTVSHDGYAKLHDIKTKECLDSIHLTRGLHRAILFKNGKLVTHDYDGMVWICSTHKKLKEEMTGTLFVRGKAYRVVFCLRWGKESPLFFAE